MADPVNPSAETPAAPATAATGAAAPAAVGTATDAQASPAAVTTAVAAAEGTAAPAAAAPELIPSLLETFDVEQAEKAKAKPAAGEAATIEKPAEVKPEDKKPADAAAETAKPATPEPIVYEYAMPEGFKIEEPDKLALNAALESFRADPKAGVQSLINLHAKALTDYAAATTQRQYDVFNQTRRDWQKEVMSDPQIGGSGYETAMKAIARMRDRFVPEADRKAFNNFLKITGAGDNPMFLRFIHNVARTFDEPKPPAVNPKPPPNNGRPPKRGLRSLYRDPAT